MTCCRVVAEVVELDPGAKSQAARRTDHWEKVFAASRERLSRFKIVKGIDRNGTP
jgi:hypothetical protein